VVRGLPGGDVGDDAGGLLLLAGAGFVEAGLVSAGDGDCGAFLGEGVGDGASQAFGAAHDEGAAGLEVEVRGGVLGLVSRCRVPSNCFEESKVAAQSALDARVFFMILFKPVESTN
jgi:hypothetical protein